MPRFILTQHLVVAVILTLTRSEEVLTHTMMDSGATANFMDTAFAMKWKLLQHELILPILMETIDGQLLWSGPVATSTEPQQMANHMEQLKLHLAAAPNSPIELGLKWLQALDLQIVWLDGVIQLNNPKCHSHWLHVCMAEKFLTLFLDFPLEIAAFADVFGKKEAEQLPLHRPYDYPIDLVLNAKLPVGRLYSLPRLNLRLSRTLSKRS